MAEPAQSLLVHGTAIALDGRAVLIRGASGAGKSDLALRCLALAPNGLIRSAAQLVSDDQVRVEARDGKLIVSPPTTIAGLIEVRGVGIVRAPYIAEAALALVADIVAPDRIERMPRRIDGFVCLRVETRRCLISPWEASAPLKLLLTLFHQPLD